MRFVQNIVKLGVLVVLLLLPFHSFSQEHYIGVRGGYSMSSIGFNPYQGEKKGVSGIDFGLAYKLYAEKYMGTQLELNSVQKGYTLTGIDDKGNMADTTYTGRAIELPMMAQGFVKFGGFRVFLDAGAFGSYMITQKMETLDATGNTVTKSDSFTDRDRRFEYGILFGGGVAFQLKKIELQLDVRYQYSLGYALKPRYKDEQTIFANRSHLAFSAAIFYNF